MESPGKGHFRLSIKILGAGAAAPCPLFDIRRTVSKCSSFLVKPFSLFLRFLLRLERRAFVTYPMVPLNIQSGQLVVRSLQLIPSGPATKTDITDRESPAKSEFGFSSYTRLDDCNNLQVCAVVTNRKRKKARSFLRAFPALTTFRRLSSPEVLSNHNC